MRRTLQQSPPASRNSPALHKAHPPAGPLSIPRRAFTPSLAIPPRALSIPVGPSTPRLARPERGAPRGSSEYDFDVFCSRRCPQGRLGVRFQRFLFAQMPSGAAKSTFWALFVRSSAPEVPARTGLPPFRSWPGTWPGGTEGARRAGRAPGGRRFAGPARRGRCREGGR